MCHVKKQKIELLGSSMCIGTCIPYKLSLIVARAVALAILVNGKCLIISVVRFKYTNEKDFEQQFAIEH